MPLSLDWGALPALFPSLAEPERWLPLLERHWALLQEAAPRVSVTSVAAGEVVQRHYAESLELLRIIEGEGPISVLVDIGSGGGYPGLVIAAVRPEAEVHLVEPLRKRARLLEEVAAAMGLSRVTVYAQRAEEAGRGRLRGTAAAVTARAVAELSELLEYTAPLASDGGLIALPKGSGFDAELAAAEPAMAALGVEFETAEAMRPEISGTLRVGLFRKRGGTDERYPRRPGMPAKRPLGS
jgi:16S rRNA (guanine527-N7)-methyltransferase